MAPCRTRTPEPFRPRDNRKGRPARSARRKAAIVRTPAPQFRYGQCGEERCQSHVSCPPEFWVQSIPGEAKSRAWARGRRPAARVGWRLRPPMKASRSRRPCAGPRGTPRARLTTTAAAAANQLTERPAGTAARPPDAWSHRTDGLPQRDQIDEVLSSRLIGQRVLQRLRVDALAVQKCLDNRERVVEPVAADIAIDRIPGFVIESHSPGMMPAQRRAQDGPQLLARAMEARAHAVDAELAGHRDLVVVEAAGLSHQEHVAIKRGQPIERFAQCRGELLDRRPRRVKRAPPPPPGADRRECDSARDSWRC